MEVRVVFLLHCLLVFSLLKHNSVGAFLNHKKKKKKFPNKGSPLNSSIDVLIGVRIAFLPKCLLVLSLLKHRGVGAFLTKK